MIRCAFYRLLYEAYGRDIAAAGGLITGQFITSKFGVDCG